MNKNNNGDLFSSNGFTIENAWEHHKELSAVNMTSEELLDKLLGLQKEINVSEEPLNKYFGEMSVRIDKIKDIIANDEYINKSDYKVLSRFNSNLTRIEQLFSHYRRYQRAEKNLIEQQEIHKKKSLEIKKQIYELDKQSLSAEEKNSMVVDLRNQLSEVNYKFKDAKEELEISKDNYKKFAKDINVVDFKNDVLKTLASLEDDINLLVVKEESKNNFKELINKMRNNTVEFGLSNVQAKSEFDALCQRYHLSYDPTKTNTKKVNQSSSVDNIKEEEKEEKEEKIKEVIKPEDTEIEKEKKKEKEEEPRKVSNPDYTGPVKGDESLAIPKEEQPNPDYTGPVKSDESLAPIDDQEEPIFNPEEPKIKVVAKRACNWISKHKKQILIAVGIAALIATTIVALQYLIPAIVNMLEAQQVASLSSAMINNGNLWFNAVAGEQVALHGANTGLASAIQSITGTEAIFDAASGLWTFGSVPLEQFATTAAANAAHASGVVSSLSNAALGLGVGGLGLTGLGALLPKRTEAYTETLQVIKAFKKSADNLKEEEIVITKDKIIASITNNPRLSEKEKNRLIKKTNKIANNYTYTDDYEYTNEEENLEESEGLGR